MIKAILFDVDGVLLDSFEANLAFFHDLFKLTGYEPMTREAYKDMNHLTMDAVIRQWTKSHDEEEIKRIFNLGMNPESGIRHPELMDAPKNSEETISLLSKLYKLGIVTSRIRNGIYRVSQLANLKHYFQITISYEDTAKHKPSPEPLFLAAKRLQLNPQEIVYIGDTQSDLAAGRGAGMRVII